MSRRARLTRLLVIDLVLYFFISRVVGISAADLGSAPSYFAFALVGVLMSLMSATSPS